MDTILILNGVFDLISATCLICFPEVASQPHSSMYANEEDQQHPVIQRLLAYWLFMYGTVRLSAAFNMDNEVVVNMASVSYFLEAMCWGHEYLLGNVNKWKMYFVCITSVVLGLLVYVASGTWEYH